MADDARKPSRVIPTGQAQEILRLSTASRNGPKQFLSNLRYFLFERHGRVSGETHSVWTEVQFGTGMVENFKEWMRGTPGDSRGRVDSGMLVTWQPWHSRFWNNLKDAIAPTKLPPLEVSSKPIPVHEIWSKNERFKRVQLVSILVHAAVVALFVVPLWPKLTAPGTGRGNAPVISVDISPYIKNLAAGAKRAGGGGGGGEHNPIPASAGRAPKFSRAQIAPPQVLIPPNPRMAVTATVVGPPELRLPSPNMANYGDPLAKLLTVSSGPGGGGGIGTGCCGGVGPGSGEGVGPGDDRGIGGNLPGAGTTGYGVPVCAYCPSPQYSEEAVKAKYQGVVTLQVVVTADGRATNIRVMKGLGVGLNEKAIEAVHGWRFRPAIGPDHKASAVTALIEVTFRLL